MKLYALLALRFDGGKGVEKIALPQNFKLDQLGVIDFAALQTINAQTSNDLMVLIFSEEQREYLARQLAESQV